MGDSAVAMMAARKSLRDGPFYTGNTPTKGVTIKVEDRETPSTVKRFTDRYIRSRTVGLTAASYPQPCLLPAELKEFIGFDADGAAKPARKAKRLDPNEIPLEHDGEEKTQPKDEERDEERDEEASGAEELEDEFEEFEDDDYNAEKYFDDGDDDGMGDDDDGEAAY